MLASRATHGCRLHRLVLRGRTCHFASLKTSDENFESVEQGMLHLVDVREMQDWADEVVDERDACGLQAEDDGRLAYNEASV